MTLTQKLLLALWLGLGMMGMMGGGAWGQNNGTLVGSPTFGTSSGYSTTNNAANFGQAINLNGTSQYVTAPAAAGNFAAASSWTVEARIRTTNTTSLQIFWSQSSSGPQTYWFAVNAAGHFLYSITGSTAGSGATDSGLVVNDGNWHNVALVATNGTLAVPYVDGVAGTSVGSSTTFSGLSGTNTVQIGAYGGSYYFAGQIDEVRDSSVARYSSAYTPATAPFTADGSTLALYHFDGNAADSSIPSVVILPNNSAILYSPYTWTTSTSAAKTIDSGAYFRTFINATTTCQIGLSFDISNPRDEVYARLDGGAWQLYTPTASGAQTWALTMPTPTTAANHLLEFILKSTNEGADRWNTQQTQCEVTSLTLDAGASVSLPAARKYRIIVYGDSITEGVRVNGYSGIASTTDQNDNTKDYSYKLGELLDAEIGCVGFGASGMTVTGSGNVPALPSSYNYLWSGQSRSFSPVPDLVIYNEGTNEQSATLSAMQTAFNTVVSGIGYTGTANTYAGLNGTRHLILEPFGGYQAANLATIASGFSNANVVYGDTTGFWNSADGSDGLHPYAYAHLGNIAPKVAALALPLLRPAGAGTAKRRLQ